MRASIRRGFFCLLPRSELRVGLRWVGQDHLLELLRPGLMEREYRDGDYLLRQGEQGTFLLYIVEGQVEVLLRLHPPKDQPSKYALVIRMRPFHRALGAVRLY